MWYLGINNLFTGLYAYVLGSNGLYVTSIQGKGFTEAVIQQFPVGEQLAINTFYGHKPHGAMSPFPYGFQVERDHT